MNNKNIKRISKKSRKQKGGSCSGYTFTMNNPIIGQPVVKHYIPNCLEPYNGGGKKISKKLKKNKKNKKSLKKKKV